MSTPTESSTEWELVECPICGVESEEPTDETAMNCSGCGGTVILR